MQVLAASSSRVGPIKSVIALIHSITITFLAKSKPLV